MFNIGEYILDKKTNKKYQIFSTNKRFYLVKDESGCIVGKFEWELEKYSLFKKILKGIKKNGRINN